MTTQAEVLREYRIKHYMAGGLSQHDAEMVALSEAHGSGHTRSDNPTAAPAQSTHQPAAAPAPESVQPFGSAAQVAAAIADPRYRVDEAYRQEVAARIAGAANAGVHIG